MGSSLVLREGQQLARQLGAALCGAPGVAEQPAMLIGEFAAHHDIEIAGDDLEQVVEVMREPGGELPDRFHLLRLAKRLLGRASPRHVELARKEVDQRAGVVIDGRHEHGVPERRAVAAVIQYFQRNGFFASNRVTQVPHRIAVGVGTLQEPAIPPHYLGLGVACQVEERLVGEDDRVVRLLRVRDDHRHPRHLQRGEEHRPALTKARLGDGRALPVMLRFSAGRAVAGAVLEVCCRDTRGFIRGP